MSEQDFSMAFIDTADRLTTLLIHGFPFSSAIWQFQKEDLVNFSRVIAPDLRGHGQSDAVAGPYTMKLLADDCVDLMGHLGVAPPFVLNGHSMGGYIAFEIVRRYPELVGGLVLTSTRAAADSSDGKNGRDQAIKLVQENGIESVVESMLPKLFAQAGFDSESDIVEYTKEVMLETSPEGMVGALEAMRDRPDSLESLAKIEIPTLIIHGSEDQIVPVSEAEAMNDAMPNARLYVIPDAGHMPHLEQPDTYNDVLIDFLEEVDEILTKIE